MQSEMVCRGEPSLDSILAARALTKERLGVACSEDHCNKLALEIPKWKILCPYIGLKEQDEEDIEADYKNNKERKIGMLRVWRQRFGSEATYLHLAEGFESLKWRDMIIQLMDLHSTCSMEVTRKEKRNQPTRVPRLDDKPKAHEIIRVKGQSGEEIAIRDELASHWEDLCIMLDFETTFPHVMIENIRRNSRHEVQEACREVLLKWLSGQPCSSGPVTWRTLIDIMRKIEYCSLADKLEQELFS